MTITAVIMATVTLTTKHHCYGNSLPSTVVFLQLLPKAFLTVHFQSPANVSMMNLRMSSLDVPPSGSVIFMAVMLDMMNPVAVKSMTRMKETILRGGGSIKSSNELLPCIMKSSSII